MQPTHRYIVFNCKVGDSNSEIFNFQGKKKKILKVSVIFNFGEIYLFSKIKKKEKN